MRSDLKRQKTVAANKQRKSIFGALTTSQMQQKKVNFGDGLDLSAEKDNQSVGSSDSEGEGDKGKGERLDLLGYNRRRKDKLREFDFQKEDEGEKLEVDLEEEVSKATTLAESACTHNLKISLFWEEKILLLIRVMQLYACFFLFYYEYYPSYARKFFTKPTLFFLGYLPYIDDQDAYYFFMQDYDLMYKVIVIWSAITVVFYFAGWYLNFQKRLRFRIEGAYSKYVNIFRVYWWLCEAFYLPMLVSVAWPATCNFRTEREAITLLDCKAGGMVAWWVMKVMLGLAYFWAVGYNVMLFKIITQNKITTAFHEEHVQKKEVEYVLGINKIWSTEKFYTFSSFRGGFAAIYHRIIFNVFAGVMVFINSTQFEDASHAIQISIHTALVILFTVFVTMSRPYRSLATNILYTIAMTGLTQSLIFVAMKVSDYQQPIFIDKYFFFLTAVLNGLFLFIIALFIMFLCMV